MKKRLSAVTGEYESNGQQKAEWTNIGVIIQGSNGKEYVLIDPTINLAGVLVKQNILSAKKGEQPRDMVMTSIFEDQPAQQGGQQQGYQQPQQNQGYQQKPQQYNQQAGQQVNQQQGYQQK